MKKHTIPGASIFCLIAAMLFLTGCMQSRLAMDYGTSQKLQIFNQTLNPEAEKNLKPVEGLDGKAAHIAVEKYQKGFEKQEVPSNVYSISIGSISK